MSQTRQLKYAGLIQKDLSEIFQRDARHIVGNAFVTVMGVEVSPDLSFAKIFISLMMVEDKTAFISLLDKHKKEIRKALGNKIGKQVRIVPEIAFFLDETEEKAQKIDDILSGLDIPPAQDEE
ncbi:30S ribosome-binding factor RbfA [Reichenbachiella sp. MALMAid0571]|uniref:30S ribosome-binding factor RbfA n=1 Tax=Reichenbachiella sp. MALMAid0571 TaxID=3143939 RepID=UPI0032DEF51C